MNKEFQDFNSEDISLKELFTVLREKYKFILFSTSLITIFSIILSLSIPNSYQSNSLLAPANVKDSLSNKLGGYSALAGIAGINLPEESGGNTSEAIARMKSYDFFIKEILPNIKLENLVASKKWDQPSNLIIYDEKMFDSSSKKWVRKVKPPLFSKPSHQEAYKFYEKILQINEDKKTSFVTINVEHKSPYIAQSWNKLIIDKINDHMRQLDKTSAENSIRFLNESIQQTNLSEIRSAISKLLEGQIQTLMMAESNKDYIFKPIVSPLASETKAKPNRVVITILGGFLGLILSSLIAFTLHYSKH